MTFTHESMSKLQRNFFETSLSCIILSRAIETQSTCLFTQFAVTVLAESYVESCILPARSLPVTFQSSVLSPFVIYGIGIIHSMQHVN